jgi:hypothetical protein
MPRTEEHCRKISEAMRGENNGNWKGGVSPENRLIRVSARYKKWRKAVIARDEKCLSCGTSEKLEAHHIDLFSKNKAARFDPENGLTLCLECHDFVHSLDSMPDVQTYAYGVV